MKDIITVQDVRGYIDADGTAYLNAEDVARGLGFTQEKNGVEYVRWETVNRYLAEFGLSQQSGKTTAEGYFIPESAVYLLAMKASNEAAKNFQLLIATEILPTLRKTGTYSIRPATPTPVADTVKDVGATADAIQSLFGGVKRGMALAQAIDIVSVNRGYNLDGLKNLLPPADHETGFLNATQLGERLGLGEGRTAGRKANALLKEYGLQFKEGDDWRLTDEGGAFGEEIPYSRNGHSGYQIRWNESVIDELRSDCE